MLTISRCVKTRPTQRRILSEFKAGFRCRALALAMTTSVLAMSGPQVWAQPVPEAQTAHGLVVKWRAPTTLADGSPFKGQVLTGFKIYASQTRYDLDPALLSEVQDAKATSATVSLPSGKWYLWISATTEKGESELQYNSKVVAP